MPRVALAGPNNLFQCPKERITRYILLIIKRKTVARQSPDMKENRLKVIKIILDILELS